MKKKDLSQLKSWGIDEMKKRLKELEKEKTEQTLNLKMGKTKNVHIVAKIKKDVAQIKTIIRVKALTQEQTKESKESKKEAQDAAS